MRPLTKHRYFCCAHFENPW